MLQHFTKNILHTPIITFQMLWKHFFTEALHMQFYMNTETILHYLPNKLEKVQYKMDKENRKEYLKIQILEWQTFVG